MSSVARQGYQRVDSVDSEESEVPVADAMPSAECSDSHHATVEMPATDAGGEITVIPPQADASPPPYVPDGETYQAVAGDLDPSPPKYGDVVKLPTYDEVELNHSVDIYGNEFTDETNSDGATTNEEVNFGSDIHFAITFMLSFFLNWIGFVMGYCLSTSLSAQYGALSGFGLSLMKWAFIIKRTGCCANYFSHDPWIVWLFAISGWLIFLQGVFSYIKLKRAAREHRPLPSLFLWYRQ